MSDKIRSIEVFPLEIPRDTPYLGPLEEGVGISERGYFVRPGNRTVYSVADHSVLVKLTHGGGRCRLGRVVRRGGPGSGGDHSRGAGSRVRSGARPA